MHMNGEDVHTTLVGPNVFALSTRSLTHGCFPQSFIYAQHTFANMFVVILVDVLFVSATLLRKTWTQVFESILEIHSLITVAR